LSDSSRLDSCNEQKAKNIWLQSCGAVTDKSQPTPPFALPYPGGRYDGTDSLDAKLVPTCHCADFGV